MHVFELTVQTIRAWLSIMPEMVDKNELPLENIYHRGQYHDTCPKCGTKTQQNNSLHIINKNI